MVNSVADIVLAMLMYAGDITPVQQTVVVTSDERAPGNTTAIVNAPTDRQGKTRDRPAIPANLLDFFSGKRLISERGGGRSYSVERFWEDGKWTRTDYWAGPVNKSGTWHVKGTAICVSMKDGTKCRTVFSYRAKEVDIEDFYQNRIATYNIEDATN